MLDKESLSKLSQHKQIWEKNKLNKILNKRPERKDKFFTGSNIEVNRVYTELDIQELNYLEDLGFPGEYPYTRGVQPTML